MLQGSQSGEFDLYRQIFEQAEGFIALVEGPDHTYKIANGSYRALVGDRPLIGIPVREAFPDLVDQGFFELLDRVYHQAEPYVGRSFPISFQVNGVPSKRFVDFIYQPFRNGNCQTIGVFVHGYDVTEQVVALDELRASEAILRETLDAMPLSVAMFDRFEVLRMANKRATDTGGTKLNNIVGKHFRELMGEQHYAARREVIQHALAGQEITLEEDWQAPDGTTRRLIYRYVPRRVGDEVVGFYVTAMELPDRQNGVRPTGSLH